MPSPHPDPAHSNLRTTWGQLSRVAAADSEAWTWFLHRYRRFVRTGLAWLLPTGDDIDEACADFWMECFVRDLVGRADRERRFRAFLAGAIRNFARQRIRARRRSERIASLDPHGFEPVDPAIELDDVTEQRMWAQAVLAHALAAQTSGDRDLLERRYGLGDREPESVAEIAERLGIRANAVSQKLHRARGRLRASFLREVRATVDARDDAALELEITAMLAAVEGLRPGLVGPGSTDAERDAE